MADDTLKVAGLKLKVDGAAEFNKTLERLNIEIKKSSAELSKVTAEYGKGSQAIEVLNARQTDLHNKTLTQHRITEALGEALARVSKEYDENSTEAERLRVKIIESEATETRYQKRLDEVTAAIAENKKAQESLGNETEDFAKTIKLLNVEIDKSNAELSKVTAEYGKDGQAIEVLTAKHKNLESTLASQSKITEAYNRALVEAVKQHGENSEAVGELQVKISKSEAVEIGYRKSLDEVTAAIAENKKAQELLNVVVDESVDKTKQQYEQLKLVAQEMQKSGNDISKWGKEIQDVGKGISMYITAPLLALGGTAAKMAIDFESSFADVRKTVDTTEQGYKKLSDAIRKMSTEIPASAEAISQVAANAGQLGIAEKNILSFTRTMIDMGESTNLSSDEASNSLAKFANITKMSQGDFDRLGSVIVKLGNNFATTEKDIVDMAMRLAGAGANVGMTQAQIIALATALSSLGVEAEAGGSSISKVIANMQIAIETGSGQLEQFASVAGMSSQQFAKAFKEDAASALASFIAGLGSLEDKGESAILMLDEMELSEVRVRDALLRSSGASEILTESLAMGNVAWEENVALSEEAAARYGTTASQFKTLGNNIAEASISLGEGFLPFVNKLLEMSKPVIEDIKGAAEGFKNLNEHEQEAIIKTGLFIAAIGPVTHGVGSLVDGLGRAKTAIGVFKEALAVVQTGATASSAAVGGLATAINLLKGPVGWITFGVGVAAAATLTLTDATKKAREEQEKFNKTVDEYNKIVSNGVQTSEVNSYKEKITTLEELKSQYESVVKLAKAMQSDNSLLHTVGALDSASKELGIDMAELELAAASFGIGLSYVDENSQLVAVSLGDLDKRLGDIKTSVSAAEIDVKSFESTLSELASRKIDAQNIKELIDTYKDAEIGTTEWKAASDALFSKFPEYNTQTGLNISAIEALNASELDLIQTEHELTKAQIDSAKVTLQEKVKAIETEITVNSYALSSLKQIIKTQEDDSAVKTVNIQKIEELQTSNVGLQEKLNGTNDIISMLNLLYGSNIDYVKASTSTNEENAVSLEQLSKEQEELNKEVSNNISELDSLNKMYQETSKKQELNSTQLLDMIDKYPIVAEYINLTGDATLNNGEIIKQVYEIKKQDMINTLSLRKQDLESELATAKSKLDIVSQEYAEKARIVKAYYSAMGAVDLGESVSNDIMNDPAIKAAQEAYDAISKSLSGIDAQLKVVNQITIKTTDNMASGGGKAANSMGKAKDETAKMNKELEKAELEAEKFAIKTAEINDKISESAESIEAYYKTASEASDKAINESKDSTVKAVTESAEKSKAAAQEVLVHKEKIAEISGKINELLLQDQTKTTEAEIKKLTKELDETVKLAGKASETAVKEAANTTETIVKANESALKLLGQGLTDALKNSYDEQNNAKQNALDTQLDAIREASYREISYSQDASDQKIRVWDDEFYEKLRQIEGIEDADIESVKRRVDNELTEMTRLDTENAKRILKQKGIADEALQKLEKIQNDREIKQQQERLKELTEAVENAETDEERARASKRLDDYKDELAYQAERKVLQDEYNAALEETDKLIKKHNEDIKNSQEKIDKIQEEGIESFGKGIGELKKDWDEYYKDLENGAEKYAAELVKNFDENQDLIISILNVYNPKWRDEGKSFIDYFQEGLDSGEIDLAGMLKNIEEALEENKPEGSLGDSLAIDKDKLDESIKEAAQTLGNNSDEMKKASQKLANAAKEPLERFKSEAYKLGQDTGQGYADGLSSKLEQAKALGAALANATKSGITETAEIRSPSKVTRRLGRFTGDGYIFGLQDRIAGVRNTSRLLAEASMVNLDMGRIYENRNALNNSHVTQETKEQPVINLYVNVAKVDATSSKDIQAFSEQIAFTLKSARKGRGGR